MVLGARNCTANFQKQPMFGNWLGCLVVLGLLALVAFAAVGEENSSGLAATTTENPFLVEGMIVGDAELPMILGGQRPADEMTGNVRTHNIWIDSDSNRPDDVKTRKENNREVVAVLWDVGCAVVATVNAPLGISLFAAGQVTRCGNANARRADR
jgi:hypothetical protein